MNPNPKKALIVASILTLTALLLCTAVLVASEDPPGGDPGESIGSWVITPYAQQSQSTCDASAGEICMEWCWNNRNNRFSGTLCCVANGVCRTPR